MKTIDDRSDSQAMEFDGRDLIQRVMGYSGDVKANDSFELQD